MEKKVLDFTICNNDLLVVAETVYVLANQSVTPNIVLAITQI